MESISRAVDQLSDQKNHLQGGVRLPLSVTWESDAHHGRYTGTPLVRSHKPTYVERYSMRAAVSRTCPNQDTEE